MNDEALNMSIRKFLKTVGVNSQLAIEKAVRKAIEDGKLKGSESLPVAMTLKVGGLDVSVTFDGELIHMVAFANADREAGEAVDQGNEAGAPVNPLLLQKVLATTVLAAVIYALIWGQMTYGWIGFENIPFLKDMPSR